MEGPPLPNGLHLRHQREYCYCSARTMLAGGQTQSEREKSESVADQSHIGQTTTECLQSPGHIPQSDVQSVRSTE